LHLAGSGSRVLRSAGNSTPSQPSGGANQVRIAARTATATAVMQATGTCQGSANQVYASIALPRASLPGSGHRVRIGGGPGPLVLGYGAGRVPATATVDFKA